MYYFDDDGTRHKAGRICSYGRKHFKVFVACTPENAVPWHELTPVDDPHVARTKMVEAHRKLVAKRASMKRKRKTKRK